MGRIAEKWVVTTAYGAARVGAIASAARPTSAVVVEVRMLKTGLRVYKKKKGG